MLTNCDVPAAPRPLISPVLNRMGSVVADDASNHSSSPTHRKRHDSVTGGETYWLVMQTEESRSGANLSPRNPAPLPPLAARPSRESTKEARHRATRRNASSESLISSTGAIEKSSSRVDSETVVINSDRLWGHQQPLKEAKDQSGARSGPVSYHLM